MRDWIWDDGEGAYPPNHGTSDEEKKNPTVRERGRRVVRQAEEGDAPHSSEDEVA